MIKINATAIVHYISPVIEIPPKAGGQPFHKRTLVLNDPYIREGVQYNNLVEIEFTGDKMDQLNSFAAGMYVAVEAFVTGREHNGRVFNTIRGMSVALHQQPMQTAQMAQAPQAPQAAPAYAPAPTSQQPYVQQAPGFQQPPQQGQPAYTPAPPQQGYAPGVADLPFTPK